MIFKIKEAFNSHQVLYYFHATHTYMLFRKKMWYIYIWLKSYISRTKWFYSTSLYMIYRSITIVVGPKIMKGYIQPLSLGCLDNPWTIIEAAPSGLWYTVSYESSSVAQNVIHPRICTTVSPWHGHWNATRVNHIYTTFITIRILSRVWWKLKYVI